ncbi:MAG: hypothetical protein IT442_09475 [Phycisphaeraceae bacterium]|nr:hypothetical protein [Phycisphaeraceae bacterium]
MSRALEKYLDQVMIYANRKPDDTPAIRAELRDHLLTKVEDLKAQGLPPEDAVFQAIEDAGHPRKVGYGLRPKFPWIDVRHQGTARGVIAIGPKAVGIIASGGAAFGVISFGGFSVGILSIGGFAAGLLLAWGGFAFVPLGLAYGGFALGLLAVGGFAAGLIAAGGAAVGVWAVGGAVRSLYPIDQIPQLVKTILAFSLDHQAAFTLGLVAIFLPLMAVAQWALWRERHRVKTADPTLLEA